MKPADDGGREGAVGQLAIHAEELRTIVERRVKARGELRELRYGGGSEHEIRKAEERLAHMDRQLKNEAEALNACSAEILEATADLEAYDRTILSLATGALAISVTFKGQFTAHASDHVWLLGLAWLFLTSTVVIHLFRQASSINTRLGVQRKRRVPYYWAHMAPAYSFVAGLVAFFLFAVVNLG